MGRKGRKEREQETEADNLRDRDRERKAGERERGLTSKTSCALTAYRIHSGVLFWHSSTQCLICIQCSSLISHYSYQPVGLLDFGGHTLTFPPLCPWLMVFPQSTLLSPTPIPFWHISLVSVWSTSTPPLRSPRRYPIWNSLSLSQNHLMLLL